VQLRHRADALAQVSFETAQETFEVVEETLRVDQDGYSWPLEGLA
jgi:hypothetical protein